MSKNYEMVNHPSHYKTYEEVVEIINKVAGPFIASMWCKWNGFKYRMRMGTKPNNPIEQEIGKENVYLTLYEKFKKQWKDDGVNFDNLTEDEKDYIAYLVNTQRDKIEKYIGCNVKFEKYFDDKMFLKG